MQNLTEIAKELGKLGRTSTFKKYGKERFRRIGRIGLQRR
jgi:hypothetical protein